MCRVTVKTRQPWLRYVTRELQAFHLFFWVLRAEGLQLSAVGTLDGGLFETKNPRITGRDAQGKSIQAPQQLL